MSISTEKEKLVILIPCYNEEANIENTVQEILAVTPRIEIPCEIVMIDDGSTDATREKMQLLAKQYDCCRIEAFDENHGIGFAIVNSYNQLEEDNFCVYIPGDGEFIADSLIDFVEARHRYDIILGYVQNIVIRSLWRRFLSGCFLLTARLLYSFRYRYINGLWLFKVKYLKNIDVVSTGHAFCAELLAKVILKHPKVRIGEVPFLEKGRIGGGSKAVRPLSILKAIINVAQGFCSVGKYRKKIIKS